MKILHVINSLVAAGAENLVVTLANEQIKKDPVSIFTFYSEKDIFAERLDPRVNFFPNNKQTYFSLKKNWALYRHIKEHDLIHVHLFPQFYIAGLMSLFFKRKRFVYTEHNTENSRRKAYFKFIERFIYRQYDHIICISKGVKENLDDWVGDIVDKSIILNSINIEEIKKAVPVDRSSFGLIENSKLLIMVGRFQAQKDQDTIIKSLNFLPENYILLLIGEGEREKHLKNLVLKLNLVDRVKFLGVRNNVYNIIKSCNIGILSSHWEGFGIVALEYIACGLPALGSKNKGLQEVIRTQKALFEISDYKQLAEIILRIEKDLEFYNDIFREQQRSLSQYKVEVSVAKHYDIYNINT